MSHRLYSLVLEQEGADTSTDFAGCLGNFLWLASGQIDDRHEVTYRDLAILKVSRSSHRGPFCVTPFDAVDIETTPLMTRNIEPALLPKNRFRNCPFRGDCQPFRLTSTVPSFISVIPPRIPRCGGVLRMIRFQSISVNSLNPSSTSTRCSVHFEPRLPSLQAYCGVFTLPSTFRAWF